MNMSISLEQLNKIRGLSLDELRVRMRQGAAKLRDRFRRALAPEMSDAELAREFHPVWRDGTGEEAADRLRCRMRARSRCFLPSLARRGKIVEVMNRRFPAERDAIINAAESALRGKFSLLGHGALSFGDPPYSPIDWMFDPVSGKCAPVLHWSKLSALNPLCGGDPKVVWELNRHSHFVTLGQAYWLTNDSRFAAGFRDQVSDWIDANPVGMGINWASSLEVAFRSISWLWATQMLVDSGEVTPDFFSRLLKSLIEHGRHIETYLSYYFSPNTHLTGEALGLFYLGMALPELRRAEGWRKAGLRILLEQLPKHVRSDGVYFEQASYYHRYTVDFYAHLFAIIHTGGANGIALPRYEEQTLWRKLEAALDHLMWIGRPDGSWPLIGDDDGGRLIKLAPRPSNDFRDTLAIGAAIFKRGDWKHVAGDAPSEMLWLLGPEGVARYDRLQAAAPREVSLAFETGGYFVMRDGWERDSSFVLIDCGRHGSEMGLGHAHSDALAIELALRGATWLVDPATYVYGAEAEARDWFRSTRAHNTATVDGEDQSEPSTPFAWKTSADCNLIRFDDLGDCVIFEGSHDGYHRLRDPVTHIRSVVMLRKQSALIVSDRFADRARHDYAIRYHFAQNCEAYARDNRIEARMPNGESLVINFFAKAAGPSGAKLWVEGGWVSSCYGQRAEAPVAVFEVSGDGMVEITTVIVGEPCS